MMKRDPRIDTVAHALLNAVLVIKGMCRQGQVKIYEGALNKQEIIKMLRLIENRVERLETLFKGVIKDENET